MNQLNKEEAQIIPEPPVEKDPELDKINEIRWDYDLPKLTRDDIKEHHRRSMDEQYGYDIDK